MSKRDDQIAEAEREAMEGNRVKDTGPKASDNPFKAGSARSKLWERRRQDRMKEGQSTDSNQ